MRIVIPMTYVRSENENADGVDATYSEDELDWKRLMRKGQVADEEHRTPRAFESKGSMVPNKSGSTVFDYFLDIVKFANF